MQKKSGQKKSVQRRSTAKKPAAKKSASKKSAKKPAKKSAPGRASKRPAKSAAATKSSRKKGRIPIKPQPKKTSGSKVLSGKSKAKSETKGKKRRERKPKPPAKTMQAPEPVRDILVLSAMPDVRRAVGARERRRSARGHMKPDTSAPEVESDESREPIDASLIMQTLAVDVAPKIEDNYDYSVLDEFQQSKHCPNATRMVNTGCGGGEAAVYFAKIGFQCVGIDPDRSEVGLARERAWLASTDIDFMVGDLFETPNLLPAGSFGLAVDRGAFSKIEEDRDRQRYLSNIRRLLFEGGVLFLSAGYFPLTGSAGPKKKTKSRRAASQILLAREGGVVVGELRKAGFTLLHRVLRQTADSGDLGELLLTLRK